VLIAVIGGKLQGVEAVYLAQKAGWQAMVIDKDPEAPATGLCDLFMEFEFSSENPLPPNMPHIDLILPAIEDQDVLSLLQTWSRVDDIPLAFDPDAYTISRSKVKSNTLFQIMNIAVPRPWPNCDFPVVIKPDQASGSRGVKIIDNRNELLSRLQVQRHSDSVVIQEFIEGPSYSVEVVGRPGNYQAVQVTDLGMDRDWDCNKVAAPTKLPGNQIIRFKEMAAAVAEKIQLTGIMDLEVIYHQNELKLLEIDARLPSQTPTAVFWSAGINLVEMLVNPADKKNATSEAGNERPVLLEHIRVTGVEIEFLGEHIMAEDGPLHLETDFFGADEAVTSFCRGKSQWVATMIFIGKSQNDIAMKREDCYEKIVEYSKKSL